MALRRRRSPSPEGCIAVASKRQKLDQGNEETVKEKKSGDKASKVQDQAHAKPRRVLDRVVIPIVRIPTPSESPSQSEPQFGKADIRNFLRPRAAKRDSVLPTPSISVAESQESEGSEESDDEPVRRRSGARKGAAKRTVADDSDFEAGSAASSEEDELEDVVSEEDDEMEEEHDFSDISEEPKRRQPGKGKASKPAPEPVTKTSSSTSSGKMLKTKKRMVNVTSRGKFQIDLTLPPLHEISDIFKDMVSRALPLGLRDAASKLEKRPLRVATMCSGTESPLLALEMIRDAMATLGEATFNSVHLFSAEIVPYKQAYIERNFGVPVVFRDIRELTAAKDVGHEATTAYGAKAVVPGDVDVVIAGTACVDYSMLNKKQKSIDDNGESGDTFRAVLSYAKLWRPRMLILENVFGAPWDEMFRLYEAEDYDVGGVLVDTKSYYLPQTRQRGYMFCLDRRVFGPAGLKGVRKWETIMEKLRRPASSPASDFLLANDDPLVLRSRNLRARQALLNDSTREVDWSRCAIRHVQYRREKAIGNSRPYTSWQESGSVVVPDYADKDWHARQVERIWDMQDCSFLRKALPSCGNYDPQFKTRVWDLSQNIDRFTDTAPFGVATCLTPTGIFFVTDRGAPLSAQESLKLQGLPIDRISLTTETSAQIQDLAGNAMSSTVVGAALIAALLVAPLEGTGKTSSDESSAIGVDQDTHMTTSAEVAPLVSSQLKIEASEIDVKLLLKEAAASAQRCTCEGPNDIAQKPIQTCNDCGHTTCLACGGKPMHNYDAIHVPRHERKAPADFIRTWGSQLPAQMQIVLGNGIDDVLNSKGKHVDLVPYIKAVKSASDSTFHLSGFHRGREWTITYSASHATLELALDHHSPQWRLFAKPAMSLSGNNPLRKLLAEPVAVAPTQDALLLPASWSVRIPLEVKGSVSIKGQGGTGPSWMARLHLPEYGDQKVDNELMIDTSGIRGSSEALSGTYKHLAFCGTACDSLYKQVDSTTDGPHYLMLDPDGIGEPAKDGFVITTNPFKLCYGKTRQSLLKLDASWRPWFDGKSKGLTTTKGLLLQQWEDVTPDLMSLKPVTIDLALEKAELGSQVASVDSDCGSTQPLVRVKIPQSASTISREHQRQEILSINAADHGWMFEAIRSALPFGGWHEVKTDCLDAACETCCPAFPATRWKWSSKGDSLQAYEDPAMATTFEALQKKRPSLFTARVCRHDGYDEVSVSLNLASLIHRAIGRLGNLASRKESNIQVTWTLDTSYAETTSFSFPDFVLRNNDRDIVFNDKLDLEVELWPKQRQSLAWMLQQETGKAHMIEQAEEATMPSLRWRAEARACETVSVRGGIQASHPGFGKTICSLALVRSDFQNNDDAGVISSMEPPTSRHVGCIPLSATLIIAPKHLVKQWHKEVTKVLGKSFALRTIAIQAATDLHKYEIAQFEKARIIIVNQDVLTSEQYVRRLAQFAGVPGPMALKGREFKSWLEFAQREIPGHLDILREKGNSALVSHVKARIQEHLEDDAFLAVVPSKRLKGSVYAKQNGVESKNAIAAKKSAASAATVDRDNVAKCLFEMFYFNRIVVDEFTYLNAKDYASILALGADKRWALSATARLQDPYDIAKMASLIGVPLRVGENSPGAVSIRNLRSMWEEMTDFEKFQTFRDAPTSAITQRTYQLAQEFLNNFVRRNVLEFDEFPYQDSIVPVSLNLSHRVIYTELSQHLNSQDMRIKKGKKATAESRDRDYHLHENLKDVASAEEALSRLAAYFNDTVYDTSDSPSLEDVIAKRLGQCTEAESALGEAIKDCQKFVVANKEHEPAFQAWKDTMLIDQSLGDEETIETIAKLVKEAVSQYPSKGSSKTNKGGKKASSDDEDDSKSVTKESKSSDTLREKVSLINDLAKHTLATKRSIRFVTNAQKLAGLMEKISSKKGSCDCDGCATDVTNQAMSVSSLCGHVICSTCLVRLQNSTGLCNAVGCKAPVQDYHLLKALKMSYCSGTNDSTFVLGAKVSAVLELLQKVNTANDQAILFVQYEDQIALMEKACHDCDLRCSAVYDNNSAASIIASFQKDMDPMTRSTVIILNASNESAAGVNLTNANHAIFMSPLLTETQYDYESQMAQAVGRIRRPGQKKDIHVYRFLALDTIDVDILEHRERRDNAIAEQDAPERSAPTKQVAEKMERERTQLVKIDNVFRLMPRSWLVGGDGELGTGIEGRARVKGYEDFSSLVKFSKAYSEED